MKEQIQNLLPSAHPWADRIHWFDTIGSTNTQAKLMALEGAPHGTILIAGRQTAGRGRIGRSFHSPGGMGVYMSVILRPGCPQQQLMHLTCAVAVAVCDAIEKAAGVRPGIKWTNDLVCGKRKIAGILTELVTVGRECCAVVGIGINCCQQLADFSEELRSFAGSLAMATGKSVDRDTVAAALITALAQMDQTLFSHKEAMLEQYRRDCVTIGQDICVVRADTIRHARALGIDEKAHCW
jgi:BirA family biotin operon repressor/biotin-[acetyl-CoA-carboxylase] ligase